MQYSKSQTLQKYSKSVTKARSKLVELEDLLLQLIVICAFFNGLNILYQIWKDMYLGGFSKDNFDKDGKNIELISKEIFKLLIDKKSRTKILATLMTTIQGFKPFKESSKKPKKKKT